MTPRNLKAADCTPRCPWLSRLPLSRLGVDQAPSGLLLGAVATAPAGASSTLVVGCRGACFLPGVASGCTGLLLLSLQYSITAVSVP